MIINLFLFVVLELASGFCNNLSQFLAVRSLYGIAMGGKVSSDNFLSLADQLTSRRALWTRSCYCT